jgi:hypothetical protein
MVMPKGLPAEKVRNEIGEKIAAMDAMMSVPGEQLMGLYGRLLRFRGQKGEEERGSERCPFIELTS